MKASDYRKLASAKRAEMQTFDVTVPSGGVWKMLEPPIQQWVVAGKLPASLTAKMAEAVKNANGDKEAAQLEVLANLKFEDVMANLEFGRDLLLYCAVEPQIALNPVNDNQIAPSDILPEDFNFLIHWALTGGKSGESLNTFRSE